MKKLSKKHKYQTTIKNESWIITELCLISLKVKKKNPLNKRQIKLDYFNVKCRFITLLVSNI